MGNGVFDAYLPQSSGYAIILGGGSGFALFMLLLSWLQAKFTETSPFESEHLPCVACGAEKLMKVPFTDEEFSSASRSVKPGLVCSGIVSLSIRILCAG